ncbi:MAG TPA: histidine kinase dimerization/phospho-acceptor domain-containing protein, partial [Acidimicrobiales bacterium]
MAVLEGSPVTTGFAGVVPIPAVVVGALVVLAVVGGLTWALWKLRRSAAEARRALADERARSRAAHDAAEELRSRLERSLDAIPQGVLIADLDGEVRFRNRVAETFASARHSDALVEAAVDELLAEALAGTSHDRTIDLFGPPRRTLVIHTVPLADGALVVIDDISERRRLDATRRDFVANISHELKTPVGAMGLLAETLTMEDDPVVARRLAERIVDEAFRMDRTIEDLLVLSRIEGEEAMEPEPVVAGAAIAEAVERIRPGADQAGISIEVADPDPALVVFGDRRQIVSALYNLLDNAVKYSDEGDVVEVRASSDGTRLTIDVQDHGIGIPKGDLERV